MEETQASLSSLPFLFPSSFPLLLHSSPQRNSEQFNETQSDSERDSERSQTLRESSAILQVWNLNALPAPY